MNDKKLTKREFDAAVNALRDELPANSRLELADLERKADTYTTMRRCFSTVLVRSFGVQVEVVGSVWMNAEAGRIDANGCIRITGENTVEATRRPTLYGDYDVCEGKWNLRWW